MSDIKSKAETVAANMGRGAQRLPMLIPAIAVALTAILAGCADRDSVTVGSIPDDYRTNHPIVIAEKDQKIDLPVGAGDHGMTRNQRETLLGFLYGYDRRAAPLLTILVPEGSVNEVAARTAGRDFARLAVASGVRKSRVVVTSYQALPVEVSAPVRVIYTAVRAQTNKCGRWPEDLADTTDNRHYANFGCAYQNNLAAQVANPNDFIGPRKQSEIDAENRSRVIDIYRKNGNASTAGEVNY